jgi:hypothetical protein
MSNTSIFAPVSKSPSSMATAKPVYYCTDGSGRDSYVKTSNGGLTASY